MIEINGISVYNSLAMGRLHFFNKNERIIKRLKTDDPDKELEKFEAAQKESKNQLEELYEKAIVSVGEANAQVFQIHIMMLEDGDFCDAISNMIKTQQVNAEYAISYTADIFAKTFGDMEDEYMQARAADVRDISERLISAISGGCNDSSCLLEPSIVVADDFTPSETVRFDKDKILGFVTFNGSKTSHTAILARTMNIPAIINTGEINPEYHARLAILDGHSGTLYIDPDDDKIQDFKHRKKMELEHTKLLAELKNKPNVTKSGKQINIYANIGNPRDLPSVVANDAGGIGLFRSEFLYLEKDNFPTEDEQFLKYKEVAEGMGGKPVIIRTLDIGADKNIPYFNLPKEENPALGYRAIRICLTETSIFKTQLRAILRASAFGNILIMFPMIASKQEVVRAKSVLSECMTELKSENIPFNPDISTGIMIETPAAAIISDMLAPEVDFFSIGTNDLTQYTLAADRQNHHIDSFINPHHPAILRLIETICQNAHAHGKWVGICGELASDTELSEFFIKTGIDELSVSPSQILKLRETIRNLD